MWGCLMDVENPKTAMLSIYICDTMQVLWNIMKCEANGECD